MVLITGASSGIGRALAELLAHEGKALYLVARREERLMALSERLQKISQQPCFFSGLDVSDAAAVAAWSEKNAATLAGVEVLVNNAGLAIGRAPLQDGNWADWDAMWRTNVAAVLQMTRRVLPPMIARRRGHIVNIGSVAGRWAYPGGNVYCATKAAIGMLTEALRMDLLGTGVRVTNIVPGMVETEFSEVRFDDPEVAAAVYKGMTPLTAADVAESVAWSLSRPAHVNIQEIVLYPTDQASPMLVHRTDQTKGS